MFTLHIVHSMKYAHGFALFGFLLLFQVVVCAWNAFKLMIQGYFSETWEITREAIN